MKKTFLYTGPIFLLLNVLIMGIYPGHSIQDNQKSKVISSFRVISTSPNGLVIEYTPMVLWNSITVQGNSYRNFSGTGMNILGEPGSPQIIKQSIIVGIPPGSEVRVEVGERAIREEVDKPLLPVPYMSIIDGLPTEEYRQNNETYRSDFWLPDSLTGLGEIGCFRDMTVARLDFHPVQYLPIEKKYRIVTRLVVNVLFNNSPTQNKTASNLIGNSVVVDDYYYKQVIINYDQAKQWRTVQSSAPKFTRQVQFAGRWFKIMVSTEGMYQITGETLQNSGLSLSGIDPSRIRMYNNGGFELPQELDTPRPEGLQEIAVRLTGTEDGRFDTQDAIVFYGRQTSGWKYNSSERLFYHYIHHYQDKNVYWLQLDSDAPELKMATATDITTSATIRPTFFLSRIFREDEHDKLYESGLEWYADKFNTGDRKDYEILLPGYVPGSPVNYAITLKGGSSGLHQFVVREGSKTLLTPSFFSYTESVFRGVGGTDIQNQKSQVSISYQGSIGSSLAFLDWFEALYRRALESVDNTLTLYGPDTTGIIEYSVSGFSARPEVYDITDWQKVRLMPASFQGGNTTMFRDSTRIMNPKTYIITTPSQYRKVTELQPVTINDLRAPGNSADFIIIAHDDFAEAMRPFKEMKERHDSLKTEIVRISDVYHQFSGGLMDATAIRDFLKYAYHNWHTPSGRSPRYVLLVGDGDYDFKNVLSSDDKNWIPPFEIDSDNELITRCTDDWYVYLTGNDRIMDMAIGRLPVRSVEDVQGIVEKYKHYTEGEDFDQWRTTFTLVADDELTPGDNIQRIHTDQSEELANAAYIPRILNQKKIYLMEYPAERNVSETGIRKPQAENDFVAQLNRGTVLVSYIGHGNHQVLAHERVFNQDRDFNLIQNGTKYFFFYPATCAFGRYDLPMTQSFAEELINVGGGGSIGMLSSARDVFARQNFDLAQYVYETLFSETPTARIGDAVMIAKGKWIGNLINNEKFHLFADPTLRLAIPRHRSQNISITPDSLPALGTIKTEGTLSYGGTVWNNFDGKVALQVFDSERMGQHTMENDEVVKYRLPGASIFKGISSFSPGSAGKFSMKFIVPKDITYGGLEGRLSTYFWSQSEDGAGYLENIRLGGTAAVGNDSHGPEITIGFENYQFISGDILGPNPVLQTTLSDQSGINITGEIGHKIEMVIDEKSENQIDLSEYFTYNEGSFTEGTIRYSLINSGEGYHTLRLKAWDNYNNSSESLINFQITTEKELTLKNLWNFPNPFSRSTQFTFEINQPSTVSIKIFSVAGRLVQTFNDIIVERAGIYVSPLWNGNDEEGDLLANGVYFYKIIARELLENNSKTVEKIGKLVIMR